MIHADTVDFCVCWDTIIRDSLGNIVLRRILDRHESPSGCKTFEQIQNIGIKILLRPIKSIHKALFSGVGALLKWESFWKNIVSVGTARSP